MQRNVIVNGVQPFKGSVSWKCRTECTPVLLVCLHLLLLSVCVYLKGGGSVAPCTCIYSSLACGPDSSNVCYVAIRCFEILTHWATDSTVQCKESQQSWRHLSSHFRQRFKMLTFYSVFSSFTPILSPPPAPLKTKPHTLHLPHRNNHSGPNVQNVATGVEQIYPLLFECRKPRLTWAGLEEGSTLSLDVRSTTTFTLFIF